MCWTSGSNEKTVFKKLSRVVRGKSGLKIDHSAYIIFFRSIDKYYIRMYEFPPKNAPYILDKVLKEYFHGW